MLRTNLTLHVYGLIIMGMLGTGSGLFSVNTRAAHAPAGSPHDVAVGGTADRDGPKDKPRVRTEFEKLQGRWSIVSLEVEGTKVADNMVKGAKVVLQGNAFTTISMGAVYKGTISVDATRTPPTLDMHFTEGPEKGKTSRAIYELNGDTWKICLGLTGKDRPKEFVTKAGSGHALETLTREAGDRGEDARAKELAQMQGEWSMVSGEIAGQPLPEALVKTGKRVVKGNETTSTIGGQLFFKANFTIDPTKKPKTIDYQMIDGPTKGKVQYGIYDLKGDTIRFCFSAPGKDRPTQFMTKAGDEQTLSSWKKPKANQLPQEGGK
jgi:uncharacterized protein (TIGR03067 family)